MALRGGLEMAPARSHKPITRVRLPLSQFDAGVAQREERLFRKQQATGSRPAAGFRETINGLWGCRGWPPVLHTGKQPGSIPGRSTAGDSAKNKDFYMGGVAERKSGGHHIRVSAVPVFRG